MRTMRARGIFDGIARLLLAVGLCLAMIFGATAFAGVSTRETASSGKAANASGHTPFHAGERLFFEVGWMNLTDAATAELAVVGRQDFYGDAAWHFQAVAHTQNPLRYVMALDDQFDSYADQRTFATRQYELYLHEQGKQAVKRLALNQRTPGTTFVVAPTEALDPLSALYRLREVNWYRNPDLRATVYDGTHFYQMTARRAAEHDRIIVPAGTFDATRIEISIVSRKSGTSMNFTLWLANNPARTPVEVDAQVPVGAVKGQLTRSE